MMRSRTADLLASRLEPLLTEFEVSSAPWKSERGEWIVTIWDQDNHNPLIDIFEDRGRYILRPIGFGPVIGEASSPTQVPDVVRAALRAGKV